MTTPLRGQATAPTQSHSSAAGRPAGPPQRQGHFNGYSFRVVPQPPSPPPRGNRLPQGPGPAPQPREAASCAPAGDSDPGISSRGPMSVAAIGDDDGGGRGGRHSGGGGGGGGSGQGHGQGGHGGQSGGGQRGGGDSDGGQGGSGRDKGRDSPSGAGPLSFRLVASPTRSDASAHAARALAAWTAPVRGRLLDAATRGDGDVAAVVLTEALLQTLRERGPTFAPAPHALRAELMAGFVSLAPPRGGLATLQTVKTLLTNLPVAGPANSEADVARALLPLQLLMAACPRTLRQRELAAERLRSFAATATGPRLGGMA